jgi:hypothetical protein
MHYLQELVDEVGKLRKDDANHPLFLSLARRGEVLELNLAEFGPDCPDPTA